MPLQDSSPTAPVENKRARTTLNIAQSCIEGVPTTEVTVNLASCDRTTVILHADEQYVIVKQNYYKCIKLLSYILAKQ